MLKRTLRLSTITLCILCTFLLICTGVFAATKQHANISTTVQFTPETMVLITAKVGNSDEQVIFNNTNDDPELETSAYFTINTAPTNFSSSNEIIIKIYNYTQNASITSAIITLNNAKGAYLEKDGAQVESISFPNTINKVNNSTISSGTSGAFHIASLYNALDITMHIEIITTTTA